VQEAFHNQFHRLVDAEIHLVLLVVATTTSILRARAVLVYASVALCVPGFIVGDAWKPPHSTMACAAITLPLADAFCPPHASETEGSVLADVNQSADQPPGCSALEGAVRQLDPEVPTVLLAH